LSAENNATWYERRPEWTRRGGYRSMLGNRRKCRRKQELTGIQTIKENKQKVDTNTIDNQGQQWENPAR